MSHWPSATGAASGALPHQFSDQGRMLQVCKLAVETFLQARHSQASPTCQNVSKSADFGVEYNTIRSIASNHFAQ